MLTVTYHLKDGTNHTATVKGGLFGAWAYVVNGGVKGEIVSITYRGKTIPFENLYRDYVKMV